MVLIDFCLKMGKNYYSQLFLEGCKHVVKEKEVTRHITEDLEFSSHLDESDEE